MGHDRNDELREEHQEQGERREERRDEAFAEGKDGDEGSQDERRARGEGSL